jgi:hypothetical protein
MPGVWVCCALRPLPRPPPPPPRARQPFPWHHVRGRTGGHLLFSLVGAAVAGTAILLQISFKARVAKGSAGDLDVWHKFGYIDRGGTEGVLAVVIQDVAVIVAAGVHAVVVWRSTGSCCPEKLTSGPYVALRTPVTTRFGAFSIAAAVCMFAVSVFVPSIIGVRG